MGTKTKSAILLSSVMLLGIIIGILTGFKIVTHRIERIQNNFSDDNLLISRINQSVKPDAEQKKEIKMILDKYRPEFRTLIQTSRDEAEKLVNSMIEDLEKVLSEKQIKDLKASRFFKRRIIRKIQQ